MFIWSKKDEQWLIREHNGRTKNRLTTIPSPPILISSLSLSLICSRIEHPSPITRSFIMEGNILHEHTVSLDAAFSIDNQGCIWRILFLTMWNCFASPFLQRFVDGGWLHWSRKLVLSSVFHTKNISFLFVFFLITYLFIFLQRSKI